MANTDKTTAAKKLISLLNRKKECNCGGSCCSSKQAAISTLGGIGSNFKAMKPSAINFSDVSNKPTPKPQLGDKKGNMYLNNYTTNKSVLGPGVFP